MDAFPAFFPLAGARVAIAGEGEGALAKARLLESSPAEVVRLEGAAALDPASYAGVKLAFVAGADAAFRDGAARAARQAGAVVNVVDDPAGSDFHTPAVIDRGAIVAAIGTGGAAPMLTALLRAELEAKIPEGLGALARLLGERREAIRAAFPDLARRRVFLRGVLEGPVAEAAQAGDLAVAESRLDAALRAGAGAPGAGKVWLVEAPPARDALSLRAARALAVADELIVGEGVGADLLVLARRDAPRRGLEAADDRMLAEWVGQGLQLAVVADAAALAHVAARVSRLGLACEILKPAPVSS